MEHVDQAESIPRVLEIQAGDGHHWQAEVLPAIGRCRGVILVLPALGVEATYYAPFAKQLAGRGYTVVTSDQRGLGRSSVRPGRGVNFGYREIVEEDIPAVVDAVGRAFVGQPLFLLGHSLGGQTAALYLAHSEEPSIRGLILIASGSVYYRNYSGVNGLACFLMAHLFPIVAHVMGYHPGEALRFGGRSAARLIQDWSVSARTGHYLLSDTIFNYEASLKRVEVPILAMSLEGDSWAPFAATGHLLEKLSRAEKTHLTLTIEGGYDHFRWVRNPGGILDTLDRWCVQRVLH